MTLLRTPEPAAADPTVEGAFRRGYHHAIADVVRLLRARPDLVADDFEAWERNVIAGWRKGMPLERQIEPPWFMET